MTRRRRLYLMALAPVVAGAAVAVAMTTAPSASASDCAMNKFFIDHFDFYDGATYGPHDGKVIRGDLEHAANGTSVPRLADNNEKMYAIAFLNLDYWNGVDGATSGGRLDGIVIKKDLYVGC